MISRLITEGGGVDNHALDNLLRAVHQHGQSPSPPSSSSTATTPTEEFSRSIFKLIEEGTANGTSNSTFLSQHNNSFGLNISAGMNQRTAAKEQSSTTSFKQQTGEISAVMKSLLAKENAHLFGEQSGDKQFGGPQAGPTASLPPVAVVAIMNTSTCVQILEGNKNHAKLNATNASQFFRSADDFSVHLGAAEVTNAGQGVWFAETPSISSSLGGGRASSPSRAHVHMSPSRNRHAAGGMPPHAHQSASAASPTQKRTVSELKLPRTDYLTLDVRTVSAVPLATVALTASHVILSGSEREVLLLAEAWEAAAYQVPHLFDCIAAGTCNVSVIVTDANLTSNPNSSSLVGGSPTRHEEVAAAQSPSRIEGASPISMRLSRTGTLAPSQMMSGIAGAAQQDDAKRAFEQRVRRLLAPAFGAASTGSLKVVRLCDDLSMNHVDASSFSMLGGSPIGGAVPHTGAVTATIRNAIYQHATTKRLRADLPPLNSYQWLVLVRGVAEAATSGGTAHSVNVSIQSLTKNMATVAASWASFGYEALLDEYVENCSNALQFKLLQQQHQDAKQHTVTGGVDQTTNLFVGVGSIDEMHTITGEASQELYEAVCSGFGTPMSCVHELHERNGTIFRESQDRLRSHVQNFAERIAMKTLEPMSNDIHSGKIVEKFGNVGEYVNRFTVAISDFLHQGRAALPSNAQHFGNIEKSVFNTAAMDIVLQWYLPNSIVISSAFEEQKQLHIDSRDELISQQTKAMMDFEDENESLRRQLADQNAEVFALRKKLEESMALLNASKHDGDMMLDAFKKTYKRIQKKFIGENFLLQNYDEETSFSSHHHHGGLGGSGGDLEHVAPHSQVFITEALDEVSGMIAKVEKHVSIIGKGSLEGDFSGVGGGALSVNTSVGSRPPSPAAEGVLTSIRQSRRDAQRDQLSRRGGNSGNMRGGTRSYVLDFLNQWRTAVLGPSGTSIPSASKSVHFPSGKDLASHPQYNDVEWLQRVLNETTASIDTLTNAIHANDHRPGGAMHYHHDGANKPIPSTFGTNVARAGAAAPPSVSHRSSANTSVDTAAYESIHKHADPLAATVGPSSGAPTAVPVSSIFTSSPALEHPPHPPSMSKPSMPSPSSAANQQLLVTSPGRVAGGNAAAAAKATTLLNHVREEELEAAANKLIVAQDQLTKLSREKRQLQQEIDDIHDTIGRNEQRLAETTTKLTVLSKDHQIVSDELLSVQRRLETETNDRSSLEEERELLNEKIFTLEQEAIAAAAALSAASKARDEFEAQLRNTESAAAAQRTELESLQNEVENLNSMLRLVQVQLETEKSSSAQYLEELRSTEETLERERKEARQTMLALEQRIAEYLHQIDTMTATHRQDVERLTAEVSESEASKEKDVTALSNDKRVLEASVSKLNADLEEAKEKTKKASKEAISLREANETISVKLREKEGLIKRLENRVSVANNEAAQAREEITALEHQVSVLRTTQDEMEHTMLWMKEYAQKHKEASSTALGGISTKTGMSVSAEIDATLTPALLRQDASTPTDQHQQLPPPSPTDPLGATMSPNTSSSRRRSPARPSISDLLPKRSGSPAASPTRFIAAASGGGGVSPANGSSAYTANTSRQQLDMSQASVGGDVRHVHSSNASQSVRPKTPTTPSRLPVVVMSDASGSVLGHNTGPYSSASSSPTPAAAVNNSPTRMAQNRAKATQLETRPLKDRHARSVSPKRPAVSVGAVQRELSPARRTTTNDNVVSGVPAFREGQPGRYGLRPIDPHLDAINHVASLLSGGGSNDVSTE